MSITRYQTYAGTIQPGELFTITRAGRSVTCFEASAGLEIVIDDGSSSAFFAGVSLDFDYEFKRIQLLNPNDTPVTFQVATAMGRVNDNRLTASGIVRVADPDNGASFSNLVAYLSNLNGYLSAINARQFEGLGFTSSLLAPKHKVGASSYGGVISTSPVTIIDPASNESGVIIRHLHRYANGSVMAVHYGNVAPTQWEDKAAPLLFIIGGDQYTGNFWKPVYLPAGVGVWAIASASANHFWMDWDYL